MATALARVSDGRAVDRAYRLVWLALALFLGAAALGIGWDRAWHATRPFEGFWSPPHLFVYATLGLTTLTVARLARAPHLRASLGAAVRLPVLPYPLPGALLLAAAGLATVWLGGMLDSVWHTAFGLDETGWSLPHAMLGQGLLLAYLGLLACRLALRPRRPLASYSAVALALLALWFGIGALLGPLNRNHTAEWLRAVAALPVLAAQEPAQHTFRIYEAWDLTRTHPAFVVLAAFAVGAALAAARAITGRDRALLLVALLATLLPLGGDYRAARYFGLAADPATWLPLPYLPATLALLTARAVGSTERLGWIAAGGAFGAGAALIWGASPLVALAAGPALLAGAGAGRWTWRTLEAPSARRLATLVALLGGAVPLLGGAVDLFLRAHTP